MARLLHHFLPVFSFGLALDEKVTTGQANEAAAAVRVKTAYTGIAKLGSRSAVSHPSDFAQRPMTIGAK